ncbi:Beta-arabinofuranosyltransferase RAY1 [Bienertia sinuspersici]
MMHVTFEDKLFPWICVQRLHEESQAGFGTCSLDDETYPTCRRKEKMKKQTSNNHLSSLFKTSSV